MFTGVIQDIGKVVEAKKYAKNLVLTLFSRLAKKLKLGQSVSVNGVCLTIAKKAGQKFSVEVVPETQRKTNLSFLQKGSKVNLELPLKVGDSLDGHMVMGHSDGIGKVSSFGALLKIEFPQKLSKFIAAKGSIAINGVSFTVVEVKKKYFTVALIPYTKTHTNLGQLKKGDLVNLEVDILARYILVFFRMGKLL